MNKSFLHVQIYIFFVYLTLFQQYYQQKSDAANGIAFLILYLSIISAA